MKKSNRLLLAFFLVALLVIAFGNASLYREYRKGHITSADDLLTQGLTTKQLGPIRHISLTATVWVNIIPSDSSYLEYPKELEGNRGNYLTHIRQSGDTLFLTGGANQVIHRAFADWYYRHSFPPVNVHVKNLRSADITNAQVYFKGAPTPVTTSIDINAKGSSVWLGEYIEPLKHQPPKEYFDSLNLRLDNTVLLLSRPAVIPRLNATLDNGAELNDRTATLGAASISASADSRVSITGINTPKTIFNVH